MKLGNIWTGALNPLDLNPDHGETNGLGPEKLALRWVYAAMLTLRLKNSWVKAPFSHKYQNLRQRKWSRTWRQIQLTKTILYRRAVQPPQCCHLAADGETKGNQQSSAATRWSRSTIRASTSLTPILPFSSLPPLRATEDDISCDDEPIFSEPYTYPAHAHCTTKHNVETKMRRMLAFDVSTTYYATWLAPCGAPMVSRWCACQSNHSTLRRRAIIWSNQDLWHLKGFDVSTENMPECTYLQAKPILHNVHVTQ